jgi:hypothetical protein
MTSNSPQKNSQNVVMLGYKEIVTYSQDVAGFEAFTGETTISL